MASLAEAYGLEDGRYSLVTLHRPSERRRPEMLAGLVRYADALAERLPLVFPVHPRTRQRMADLGLAVQTPASARRPDRLPRLSRAPVPRRVVVTDSGGVQEETTYLGVPCLTVRENTERPVTVTVGTNVLVGPTWTGCAARRSRSRR